MNKLKQELIEILTYFNEGLIDVESGSGEEQPMQKRTELALSEVKNLTIPCVSKSALLDEWNAGYNRGCEDTHAAYEDQK